MTDSTLVWVAVGAALIVLAPLTVVVLSRLADARYEDWYWERQREGATGDMRELRGEVRPGEDEVDLPAL